MCTGFSFKQWQADCLDSLLSLDFVEPSLLIIDATSRDQSRFDQFRRIGLRYLLRPLLTKVLFTPRCYEERLLTEQLGHLPTITPNVDVKGEYSQHFAEDDLEKIRSYDLDFILRFGFGILRGEVLHAARYGVWSFHHQDEREYRGAQPCFWEIKDDNPVSGAILQRLTERLDGGIVLRRGRFETKSHSYHSNLNNVLLGSTHWPAAVCRDIKNGHTDYLTGPASKTDAPILPNPTNLETIDVLLRCLFNLGKNIGRILFRHEKWSIGVIDSPIDNTLGLETHPRIDWLPEVGPSRYLADPFAMVSKDQILVLCEDFRHSRNQGLIAAFELDLATTQTIEPRPTIEQYEHASYPYLFEHDNQWYCVPETHRASTVDLFAAQRPYDWRKVATLIDGIAAADPTLFQVGGRWWLTFTDAESGRYRDLHLWYADSLLSEWRPHVQNPVKTDVCSARPAGTPFWTDDTLYRPAQDCSREYGRAVVINRVEALSPTEFEETSVARIEPDPDGPYPAGLHTLASCEDSTLVDGRRWVFEPAMLFHGIAFLVQKVSSTILR